MKEHTDIVILLLQHCQSNNTFSKFCGKHPQNLKTKQFKVVETQTADFEEIWSLSCTICKETT